MTASGLPPSIPTQTSGWACPLRSRWGMLAIAALVILSVAAEVRWKYPTADPPPFLCMGTAVWDECWQHEARNKALWGVWHLPNDAWRTSVVSWPSNALTYLAFKAEGVSTRSLRLVPRIMGVLTVALLGLAAWLVWGQRAALLAGLAAALAFPLIAYARVALIEGYQLPLQALLLLLMLAQLKSRQVGILVGLTAVLCFAMKASAVLFLVPMAVAWLVVLVMDHRGGHSWLAAIRRLGIPGMLVGTVVGAGAFYLLVVRGQEADWWFLNFQHYGAGRTSGSLAGIVERFVKLPTHSDAVLVAIGPLALMAAIQAVRAIAAIPLDAKTGADARAATAIRAEAFLAVSLVAAVPVLVMHGASDVAGRRALLLVPPMLLLAIGLVSGYGSLPPAFSALSRKGRLLAIALASPLLYVGGRACYAFFTQGARAIVTDTVWWQPLVVGKAAGSLAMDFGPFLVLSVLIVVLCVWRQQRLPLRGMAWMLLIVGLAAQVVFVANYFHHRTYTVIEASRNLGKRVPPGTPVLGHDADHLAWENEIKPIFSYPGITYANRDEASLKAWNAPYAVLSTKYLGFKPGDTLDWTQVDPLWEEHATDLWRSYSRIVAVFPLASVEPCAYDPQEDRGCYLLLERGKSR
jgi:hypothetical protein